MSDWQVGDLAVCVDDGPCSCERCPPNTPTGLVLGRAYRVLAVLPYNQGCALDVGLRPRGIPHHSFGIGVAFLSKRFRKVRPDAHEKCEDEFITLLKRRKSPSREEHIAELWGDD